MSAIVRVLATRRSLPSFRSFVLLFSFVHRLCSFALVLLLSVRESEKRHLIMDSFRYPQRQRWNPLPVYTILFTRRLRY